MEVDLRAALLGTSRGRSVQGIVVAAGLAALVLAVSFLPFAVDTVLDLGLVIGGFGLASWWAYVNDGLAVSVALVLGPVGARLTYYSWIYLDRPAPVALPLSFGGHGAWEMWIPLAVVLGVIAFVVGVTYRWGRRFAVAIARSIA